MSFTFGEKVQVAGEVVGRGTHGNILIKTVALGADGLPRFVRIPVAPEAVGHEEDFEVCLRIFSDHPCYCSKCTDQIKTNITCEKCYGDGCSSCNHTGVQIETAQ